MNFVVRALSSMNRSHIINSSATFKTLRFCRVFKPRVNRNCNYCSKITRLEESDSDDESEFSEKHPLYNEISKIYRKPSVGHNIFLIQPRIKSPPNHETVLTATLKMDEAIALVETLPEWRVAQKCIVPTASGRSHLLFGSGNLEKLKQMTNAMPYISAIFIGIDMLSALQATKLENFFGVPVFDRYQIVLQIFHDHARTKEAKLQISLAEIPYLRVKLAAFSHNFDYERFQELSHVGGYGETSLDTRRQLLAEREVKLKRALEKVRKQRVMLRKSENRSDHPVVAVVGYTNCGKTTLIKSLTNDSRLQPEDKLFATLDVTVHGGFLPSNQRVLYIDTVGFISDVPTSLIQCFRSTLEDILVADVIVHVRDISHPDAEKQKKVVLQTLQKLNLPEKLLNSIVEVGNKMDMVENIEAIEDDVLLISAVEGNNLNMLADEIQEKIFENTSHGVHLFRVSNGGEEYRWLLKESAIKDSMADEKDYNYLIVETVISDQKLSQFKHLFGDLSISIEEITENYH